MNQIMRERDVCKKAHGGCLVGLPVSLRRMAILDLAVLREVLARIDGADGVTRVAGFSDSVWQ